MDQQAGAAQGQIDLEVGEAALRQAGSDFGGLVRTRPAAVIRAASVENVVAAVRHARERNLPLVARGQGHTTRGQAQADAGIVVDLRGLDRVEIDRGSARVGAGARWDRVLRAALREGLTPPVLTDYLGLTVGGTLSVGGVGGQSFRWGTQTDLVLELTVVTGRGDAVVCSPEREQELFHACRAGLGQCGIIVDARIRLVEAPARAEVHRVRCPDLASYLREQIALAGAGRADYILGTITPRAAGEGGWSFGLEVVRYRYAGVPAGDDDPLEGGELESMPYEVHASRLDAMEIAMRASGEWTAFHPWMDLIVPAEAADEVIGAALAEIPPALLAGGHVMTYPLSRAAGSTPLLDIPGDPHAFLFDILPTVAVGNRTDLTRLEEGLARVVTRAWARGARIYPIGFPLGTPLMNGAAWRSQLQAHWSRFAAAKRAYDPAGVLGGGLRIFAPPALGETAGGS
jgi:FAD/FMN-containing dehydrogenase